MLRRIIQGLLLCVALICGLHVAAVRGWAGELQPLHPGYPELFDLTGILEAVDEDKVVVNDRAHHLRSTTSFHKPGAAVGLAAIVPGSTIGLLFESNGDVKSVWLLEEKKESVTSKPDSGEKEPESPIRQENGVWRN